MPTESAVPEFKIVIPARYDSSRFPGKALYALNGKAMLQHVHERAMDCGAEEVLIALDDPRIADFCEQVGLNYLITSPAHINGTERIAEVARVRNWQDDTIVVGLQCDEPATPPQIVRQLASNMNRFSKADVATLCSRITRREDYLDPDRVKVVSDVNGFALYFSRAPIPWRRDALDSEQGFPESWLHIGMYAYRAGYLSRYVEFTETLAEREEKLEQLRALGHGCRIHVDEAVAEPSHGVDRPEDVAEAERALRQFQQTAGQYSLCN